MKSSFSIYNRSHLEEGKFMRRNPLEGKVIGSWEVLAYTGCTGKKCWYQCRCGKCGTIKSVRADKLAGGRTTQCAACRDKRKLQTED